MIEKRVIRKSFLFLGMLNKSPKVDIVCYYASPWNIKK